MKKILVLAFFWLALASCASKAEIDSAKQDLLSDDAEQTRQVSQDNSATQESVESIEVPENKTSSLVQIIPLDANTSLSFNEISQEVLTTGEVVISWTADADVDKIEVFFTNSNSTYSDDRYTLQTYQPGAGDFKYIASSMNKVLDFGINEYIFRAYSGDSQNETKVILEVPAISQNQSDTGVESQLIGGEDNSILIDLPTSTVYGEPLRLWEDSFTYTQIKWLEVTKEIFPAISCDEVTEFLWERLSTWYFWNTCRDIVADKWIKFNVIRLSGDEYVYERHYIDFVKGLYSTYELETGTWVNSDTIQEKNTELKDTDFPTIEIVDDLIKDILQA